MEFALLGPLEVRHNGAPVAIPGRHAPKLLAVLALESGNLVSLTHLVTTLWSQEPPATARRQVQNVMAALRRVLPEPDVVVTSGHGYRLRPELHTTDVREFERLRILARESAPPAALRYLRQALNLWRGETLAGLSGSVIDAAAVKLNESRISAVEDRAELELELGQPTHIVGELRGLVAANPYRQRLAGQLMRALWRTGRSFEALEVYRDLETRLADHVGLDPDAELSRLHASILRAEPGSTRPGLVAKSRGLVPAQLPAAPSTFTGRGEQVAALDELLQQRRVAAITGMGGAGKTALALYWAHRVRDRFPDGQLYINLRGFDEAEPVTPMTALGRFLVALGQPSPAIPTGLGDAAKLYRSLLADRRMLVVLDNARDAAHVRPLLPGGFENLAIVTSRNSLVGLTELDGVRPIPLDTLSREESLDLLANLVGAGRLPGDPESALRITELCGRLPLALRIAAANLVTQPTMPLADFADTLTGPARLQQLAIDGDRRASVTHTLDTSVSDLDEATHQLLLTLVLIPGEDFGRELAVHMSGLSRTRAERCLATLESAHLVEQHRPHRFRFHDLIREHVAGEASETFDDPRQQAIRSRFISWHFARRLHLPVAEAGNVVAAFDAWPNHPETWKLVTKISDFIGTEFKPAQLLSICQRALSRSDSIDPVGAGYLHTELALLHRFLGHRRSAVREAETAVGVNERAGIGDPDGRLRGNLALMYLEYGNYRQAETLMRDALRSARVSNDTNAVVAMSSILTATCRRLGRFTDAAKVITDDPGYPDLPKAALGQLAAIHVDTGRYAEAMAILNDAITSDLTPPNLGTSVIMRIIRTEALRATGEYESARRELDDIIAVLTRSGLHGPLTTAKVQLARVLSDTGDQESALRCLDSLEPDDPGEADQEFIAALARIRCLVYTRLGRYPDAIPFGIDARDRYRDLPYPLMHARSLAALGDAYKGADDIGRAVDCHRRALEVFTRLGVPEAIEARSVSATAAHGAGRA